jgi:hypothetical protein
MLLKDYAVSICLLEMLDPEDEGTRFFETFTKVHGVTSQKTRLL